MHLVDLLHLPRESTLEYDCREVRRFAGILGAWTGRDVSVESLRDAMLAYSELRERLGETRKLRRAGRLRGTSSLHLFAAAEALHPQEALGLIDRAALERTEAPEADGLRVYFSRSSQDTNAVYAALEAFGTNIVGEDHDWGQLQLTLSGDPDASDKVEGLLDELARAHHSAGPAAATSAMAERARWSVDQACFAGAEMVLCFARAFDDAPGVGLPLAAGAPRGRRHSVDAPQQAAGRGFSASTAKGPRSIPRTRQGGAAMTRKRLPSALRASAYQKQWFAGLQKAAADGQPVALVNADAPQEILRAMDIPYVVNQWWASVVSAKRMADRSLDAPRAGFPDFSRQYDAVAFDASQLPPEDAPRGGLPTPDFVIAETSADSARKVFDLWAETGRTEFFAFERTSAVKVALRWWELVPRQWEEVFGRERLDLMTAENWELVELLERRTGRKFRARAARPGHGPRERAGGVESPHPGSASRDPPRTDRCSRHHQQRHDSAAASGHRVGPRRCQDPVSRGARRRRPRGSRVP